MEMPAVAFWGAFFGSAALALVGALLAFTRSARRVAVLGALAALLSALYTLVFLGWIPVEDDDLLQRIRALTAIGAAAVLAHGLLLLLGSVRRRQAARAASWTIAALATIVIALSFLVPPDEALRFAATVVALVALAALLASAAAVRRGEMVGWLTMAALPCMGVGVGVLDWYAFHPDETPWTWHAASAVTGIAYLSCIAVAMWSRFSYLIEVSKAMTHGPEFDPVTRLRAYEAGRPMEAMFSGATGRPCGVVVISISNLKMLEDLHGRAAYNHALFVCAARLRRNAMPGAELARLREDAFVMVVRHPRDTAQLVEQARVLVRKLSRPVLLGTSRDIRALEETGAMWEASVGVGVLVEPVAQPELSVAGARAVSRTAWSFASRIGWYDESTKAIAEMPVAG